MRQVISRAMAALSAFLLFFSVVHALPSVKRVGKYLYTDSGRFYIKGIAYQEQGQVVEDPNNPFGEPSSFFDPLADGNACARDVPYLTQLGVNTIRVYSVNASLNHDACMNALSAAGIYTIIDLSLPVNGSIDRLSPSWTTNLLNLYIASIDAFSKYDNVLGYNVGNEVIITANGTTAAAYVKAAARDIKTYLKSKSSTALVAYAAINAPASWRLPLANYLSCDISGTGSGDTAIDLYGLNNYQWCGNSTFEDAYAGINSDYASYNIPSYFSEFGCISSPPRVWTEVGALFSSQMSDIWSGGIAFSYFPASSAAGQFGMVTISSDGRTVTTSADFDNLVTQYGQVTPPNTPSQAAAGSTDFPVCPAQSDNLRSTTALPPTPNYPACQCLDNVLSCRFTPQTRNTTGIVGQLLDTACSLLGQQGGNCADIASDASTGTYGRVSACAPEVKLSFVMSEFYEANKRNPQSCSFAGNGTINSNAPSTVSAANAAASSCLSNPAATFTPAAPSNIPTSRAPSGTAKTGSAPKLVQDKAGLVAFGMMVFLAVGSGFWTLM